MAASRSAFLKSIGKKLYTRTTWVTACVISCLVVSEKQAPQAVADTTF